MFDVEYKEGDSGVVALDSGAGVSVWPKDVKKDVEVEDEAPGLRMVAADGAEIQNRG